MGVVQTLARVETEHRRLKRVAVAALAGIAAVVLMGQARPSRVAKVVEAERFVLRDGRGRLRADLRMADRAGPELALYDEDVPRLLVGLGSDGSPSLALYGKDGVQRASLDLQSDGTVAMHFTDTGGQRRVGLSIGSNGVPGLALLGQDGTRRIDLELSVDGRPRLRLADANGRTHAALQVLPDGTAGLAVSDRADTTRGGIMLGPDGAPSVELSDQAGNRRVMVYVAQDGEPHLVFLDPGGRPVWGAP
jgi:hypothetical protein